MPVKLFPHECLVIGRDLRAATQLAAEEVVRVLREPARHKNVALAGGSTPAALYKALSAAPYEEAVDWDPIHWFWGDERCVPPDHPDSNFRLARELLLWPLNIDAEQIHRMPADAAEREAAAAEYEALIRQQVPAGSDGVPAFDLVLLGVGPDGHTASLFPQTPALKEAARLVAPNFSPNQRSWRLTMTYPLLRAAREIIFFVTGPAKAEVMALLMAPEADVQQLPAANLRQIQGWVTWVLDADAARLVTGDNPT